MGLFFEVIVIGAVLWWQGPSIFRFWSEWRARRAFASGVQDASGAHDKGVWVRATLEGATGRD